MSEPPSTGASLPRFDPMQPGFFADRYRMFDEYRANDPVHWNGGPSGRPAGQWFIFDHASATIVLKDKRFCRQPVASRGSCPVAHSGAVRPAATPANQTTPTSPSPPAPCAFAEVMANCMLFQDPPKHTRLRSAVVASFAAPALRPFTERRVDELIEPLTNLESFDFIKEFAVPFPLDVIGDMLGIQASERATFRHWSSALRDGVDRPKWGSDALVRAEAATLELREYFEAAWRLHQKEPKGSVLDDLFRMEGMETGLTKDEAFGTFILLISAGHETTTNLLGNGMYLFANNPGERERVLEQPELIPKAVEEILRFESPVQMIPRFVAEEVELGGRRLLPGQHVEVLVGSANRDRAVFEEPDRFDVSRTPNPHITFSLGATHCIGASIARMIGSIALPVLLRKFRALDFPPGAVPWSTGMRFRGLTHLRAMPR